jgi:5-formyltetrahydrofolate cyclo-ligase
MDLQAQKAKLRKEMIQKRESLTSDQVRAADRQGELLATLIIEHYHPVRVAAYWPKGFEYPTQTCINTLRKAGVEVFLPVVFGLDMEFYYFESEDRLRKGSFGVLVPQVSEAKRIDPNKIDVFIIPGLAYDRQLHRLGYGKGYYDRYLSKLQSSSVKIGLAYNFQVLNQIPVSDCDQPVDRLFTESTIVFS